jgi:ribosome maturation factor RimP
MNFFEKNIHELVEQVVENKGFLLIDLVLRGDQKNRVLEVYIDAEQNVSAENCAEVSREISKRIDQENVFGAGFRLEVSSPGTNRPLKFLGQFPKHTGRKFDISYKDSDLVKKFSGTLKSIEGDKLSFVNNNNEEIIIDFNSILKAKVLISFS